MVDVTINKQRNAGANHDKNVKFFLSQLPCLLWEQSKFLSCWTEGSLENGAEPGKATEIYLLTHIVISTTVFISGQKSPKKIVLQASPSLSSLIFVARGLHVEDGGIIL